VIDRAGVDALHRAVVASGCRSVSAPAKLAAPGGGYGFGCMDPDGRNLGFVAGVADHVDTQDKPDHPRKIAHVNLNARDFEATLRFFTETVGFRQIDENAPLWFLRCDSPDHSSIVLAKTNQPTLNHVAFEMPDYDSVMAGTGRATTCSLISAARTRCRSNTPRMCCRSTTCVPRGSDYWKFPPGRSDHWGITQPRSARYYRVQRLFGFTEDGWRLT
jgi:catechol 2,3-dioxygenase